MSDETFNPPMRLDADGFPILEEVVEEVSEEQIPTLEEAVEVSPEMRRAEAIKEQILVELEPRLTQMVQTVFIDTVKMVAVQMKHQFESQFNEKLQTELNDLVDQAVDEAMKE